MRPESRTALRKPSGQGHSTSYTPTKASAGPDCQGPDETRNADRGVPHLISVLLLLLAMATSDINFNVSGLFSAPAPQDKISDKPASEELPSIPTPTPATVPALGLAPTLASVATKERAESEAPHRPTSPKVSRSPPEAAAPAEEMAWRTKRPASARPTMPPPQVSGTHSSPPAPLPPPGSGSPVTPRALPRRLVGSSLRAPTVPPPLPPSLPGIRAGTHQLPPAQPPQVRPLSAQSL
ncbi:hypothetical protein AB1E18_005590 [Capra hircus]